MSREFMQGLAAAIEETLGKEYGFVVCIFEKKDNSRMNYVSNCDRADVVEALKEFIAKTEGAWGAHKL